MSEVVEVDCIIKNSESNPNEYILYPRTNLDKAALNGYVDGRGRQIRVRLVNRKTMKSYDQVKAFWSLLALHYQAFNGHAPNSNEAEMWYEDLIKPELFPVRVDTMHEGHFKPKGLSELTMSECVEVISKMLALVSESMAIPDTIAASCSDLFEWVNEQKKEKKEESLEDKLDNLSLAQEALMQEEFVGDIF